MTRSSASAVSVTQNNYKPQSLYHLDYDFTVFDTLELQCEILLCGEIVTKLQSAVGEEYQYFTVPINFTYCPVDLLDSIDFDFNDPDCIAKLIDSFKNDAYTAVAGSCVKCYSNLFELNTGYSKLLCPVSTDNVEVKAFKDFVIQQLESAGVLDSLMQMYALTL